MGNKRSDVSKISKCVFAVVLGAAVLSSGCAGVVTASNAAGSGATATPTKTPTPQPQAQLSATPTIASFPRVATGSSSSQTITLQNSGTSNVTISSASVTGAGFSTSGLTVPMSMAPGQNRTFNVVFTPSSAGSVTGSISLLSNASNSPLAISATGSGVISAPGLSASTGSLNFGSVLVGSSNSLGVTVTNTGNANAIVSSVLVTGTGFGASGLGSGATVPPGQTAALNVTFAPSTTGGVLGTLSIASNTGSLSIALAGSGGQLSSRTVALNWDPSTSDVIGYYVYRMLPDGTYGKINAAPSVLTQFTDTNVQSGQTYTYVVTSVDADNVESDYSDPAIALVP
jgi:hypothetical protein